MKKVFKYFFAATVLALTFQIAEAQQKLGYVNTQAILEEMPEVKAADAEIKTLQQQMQKKGQEMYQALQTKMIELQRRRDEGELSPKELEAETQTLQKEDQELQNYNTKMQTDILKKNQELLEPIQTKLNNAVNAVAMEDGYTFILDASPNTGVFLFADESADLTDKVKAKLLEAKE